MNYDRVHSLFSRASEAIISADGKIKQRLNNYETVVKHDNDDQFYVPQGAVNDNYGNLNYLADQIRNRTVNSRLSHLRYAMYGAFALVVIVFLWSAYRFLLPSISSIDSQGQSAANADSQLAAQIHETQLERVADLIIMDDDWSDARISVFMKHWNPSSSEDRDMYKTTAWYQQFAFRLENKFNRAIYTGELQSNGQTDRRSSLYTLALALGIADPKIDYAKKAQENSVYSRLENEVTSELVKMEKSKIQDSGDKTESAVVSDEAALAELLKDIQGKPLLPEKTVPENNANAVSKQVVDTINSDTRETNLLATTVVAAMPPAITERDVASVIQKYSTAYKNGNLNELSSLFGVEDPAQGKLIVEQLKANYANIFANSKKRSVAFSGLNWRFSGNQATVDSDYNAQIELKNNKGTQTITASARLELVKKNDELKIANLELLKRSVSVVTPELKMVSTNRESRQLPDAPTAAELQDIVTRLVHSYESGDIKTFTGLFSAKAKTNDRQNLADIKRDYQDLFKSSNDRQMFIQGMQWSYDGKYAKGTGDLEAIVLSDSGNSVYSMTGKIQLVAQRINGKVQITHMYHLEREK